MARRPALALMLCVQVASAAAASVAPQSTPNFSGEWVLQTPAEPPANTPSRLSIQHDANYLSITKTIGDRTEKVQHRLNPSTVGGTVGRGGDHTFTGVWWFGDILRFDEGSYSTPPGTSGKYIERSEAWSLDEVGRLTVQITRATEEGRSRVTLVYAKQGKDILLPSSIP